MARENNTPEEHDPTLGPAVTAVHVGGESIADRLLPHIKKIGVAMLGVALVVSAVFMYRWYDRRQSAKATVRTVRALDLIDRPLWDPKSDVPSLPPPEGEPFFTTGAERVSAAALGFSKVGKTRGATALVEARVLLEGGKLDDALALYRKYAGASGIDGLIAREGVGVVLEAQATAAKEPAARQKLLEEALAAYRAVQPDDKGLRRDHALYHEARMLETLGKAPEAIAALKQAMVAVPDSDLEPVIRNRLSALGGGS